MRLSLRRFGTLGGTVTPTFTNGIVAPSWRPASDSTTAIAVTNVAGTTILGVDTTNKRATVTGRLSVLGTNDDTVGLVVAPTLANSNTSQQQILQLQGTLTPTGASLTEAYAMINLFAINSSAANVTRARAVFGRVQTGSGYSGVISDVRTFEVANAVVSGGSITTQYGLYIANLSSASTNYSIYTGTGLVRFGGQVQLPAGTTAAASINIPHGAAPTSPVDGDMWTTTAGLYVRINGATVGPLS